MVHKSVLIISVAAFALLSTIAVACDLVYTPLWDAYHTGTWVDPCSYGWQSTPHIPAYDWGPDISSACSIAVAVCVDCHDYAKWYGSIPYQMCQYPVTEAKWKSPTTSDNGQVCKIRSGWSCGDCFPDCSSSEGKWDASESKCDLCSGPRQTKAADCSNIAGSSYERCESGCGADSACDESRGNGGTDVVVGARCESLGSGETATSTTTCDSNCRCQKSYTGIAVTVGTSGTGSVIVRGGGSSYKGTVSSGSQTFYFSQGEDATFQAVTNSGSTHQNWHGTSSSGASWSCSPTGTSTCPTTMPTPGGVQGSFSIYAQFSQTTPSCSCWWNNVGCGQGGCPSSQMYQTKSCSPSGCSSGGQCVNDCSCTGTCPCWQECQGTIDCSVCGSDYACCDSMAAFGCFNYGYCVGGTTCNYLATDAASCNALSSAGCYWNNNNGQACDAFTGTCQDGVCVHAATPDCTSGSCCDTSTNTFMPYGTLCNSNVATDYGCIDGIGCGKTVGVRNLQQFCTGSSSSCDGAQTWTGYTTVATCNPNTQKCVEDTPTCVADSSCAGTVCVPDGCNGICPAGCSVSQDPDCGCQSGNGCCPTGCLYSTDTDCSYCADTSLHCKDGTPNCGETGTDCGGACSVCTCTESYDSCTYTYPSCKGTMKHTHSDCQVTYDSCNVPDGTSCGSSTCSGSYSTGYSCVSGTCTVTSSQDCTAFGGALYCSGGNIYKEVWGCSAGFCGDSAASDTLTTTCADQCWDPDGLGYTTQNTVTDTNPCSAGQTACPSSTYTDTCVNSTHLTEYYCAGNNYASNRYNCKNIDWGYQCNGGACQASPCTITSVSLTPNCNGGYTSDCDAGDAVSISGTYTGYCTQANFAQIDMISGDGLCKVQYGGGSLIGVNSSITNSNGVFSGTWIIPKLVQSCSAKTVNPTAAALYRGGFPGVGTLLGIMYTPTGSLKFGQSNLNINIITAPQTGSITVNGTAVTTPSTLNWEIGTKYNISANSTVSCGTDCRYVFDSWSDGGAQNHYVTPIADITYTANYRQQYYVNVISSPTTGGIVNTTSGWYDSGKGVGIITTPSENCMMAYWDGVGDGSVSGSNNPIRIIINGPITETVEYDCGTSNNIVFSGVLNYSTKAPVKNSIIKISLTNSTYKFAKKAIGQTDASGLFSLKVLNIPDVMLNSDFDMAIYVVGDIEAVYNCHYSSTTKNCS
jgi:hypothetical protein